MVALADEAKADGYYLRWFEVVGSTNAVALDLVQKEGAGDVDALDRYWVVAGQQTGGRARRGRSWFSPFGNLYASLILTKAVNRANAAKLGFVAGVTIVDTIERLSHQFATQDAHILSVALKWPNDVLLNGAKSAGILLELGQSVLGQPVLIIGLGVNVSSAPSNVGYPTSSLHQAGVACSLQELFYWLSVYWSRNYALFNGEDGENEIRKKWLDSAAGLGQNVGIKRDNEIICGVFETIDDHFRCVIEKRNGERIKIASGDIFFSTVSSAMTGK